MTPAISRYGPRVLPNTVQIIDELASAGQLIDGPHIRRFEKAFADRLGDVHAVATSYGRMAFFYILKALNLPAGSEIVIPALTFWVIPEMARIAGLVPVFADVDPSTFNMTPASLASAVGPRTSAVVPTHLWGLPCDMDGIVDVARRHHLAVIEDCAHALGATYHDHPVGTLGDAALFSFQTVKPLNTYGGGMAVVRDPALAIRIAALAQAEPVPSEKSVRKKLWHGRVMRISTRPGIFTWTLFPLLRIGGLLDVSPDVYFWERIRPLTPLPIEYRERYSNVQAAIGLEGLKYLEQWTMATQGNAAIISRALAGRPGVRVPVVPRDRTHAFYQYCAYVPDRDAVVQECIRHGVDLETLHVDVCSHLPLFGESVRPTPGADETVRTVQIPSYASLESADVGRVAAVVREAVTRQAKKAHLNVPVDELH